MLDPNEYLKDEYDISKLTIPNLRSILVEHEIDFPSNAIKSELINIFNNKVKPNTTKILKKYNVNPSDSNIINMTNNNYITTNFIEPSPVSDNDKIIPAKRQSDISNSIKKPKRKTRRVISDVSSTSSPSNSFLSMEKFEINENDNIFKGPIDEKLADLLPKTKYSKKLKNSNKNILANFDKSVPESNKILMSMNDSSNKPKKSLSTSTTPLKNNSIDYSIIERVNKTIDPSNFVNDIYDDPIINDNENHLENLDFESNNIPLNNTFDYKSRNGIVILDDIISSVDSQKLELTGPTKSIKESIVNLSVSDNDDDDIIFINEKDDVLVSTLDVKSLTSMETNNISFSDNSIKIEDDSIIHNDEEIRIVSNKEEKHVRKQEQKNDVEVEKINQSETIEEVRKQIDTKHTFSQKILKFILFTFLFSNFLLSGLWIACLREIKTNTGYCGFEQQNKLLDIWGKIPNDFQESLSPIKPYVNTLENGIVDLVQFECKTCPEFGTCTNNKLICDAGYIKKSSFESLFGFIPLEETCEFDTLRQEKLEYMFKYTLSYLHRHNDRQLTLSEVHDYLKSTKPSSMATEEFEEYWDIFVNYELSKEDELNINFNTKEITLSHKTPTEYYTRTFGNVERGKTSKNLFQKTPPTVNVKNYYTVSK